TTRTPPKSAHAHKTRVFIGYNAPGGTRTPTPKQWNLKTARGWRRIAEKRRKAPFYKGGAVFAFNAVKQCEGA
ncbi:MAG: hypothetical protein II738_06305, partial [Clostridia bacterium]|nr:hypothetical protein [Clostridia bacterium]